VAEDSTNPFAAMVGALKGKSNGAGKGTRKDGKPGKVNPVLTPPEIARYTKIFGVMKAVLNPGPEAKMLKTSKAASIGKLGEMQKSGNGNVLGDEASPMGKLAAVAGLIGIALYAFRDQIVEAFEEFGPALFKFGMEVASNIGHLPIMAAKLAKFIPIKRLKMLPMIGSLLNFGFAYVAFDEGRIGEGLWELTSGLANFIPGAGPFISAGMDIVMWMYESANQKAEDTGKREQDFGPWLWEKTKEMGSTILDAIKDGKVPLLSGLWRLGEGIGYFIIGEWSLGLEAWADILPSMLGMSGDEEFLMAFDAFTDWLGEGTYNMAAKATDVASDSMSWISDIFDEIGGILKGMFTAMKDWVSDAIDTGLEWVSKAGDGIWNNTLGIFGEHGALGGGKTQSQTSNNRRTGAPAGGFTGGDYRMARDGMIRKNGKVTYYDTQDDVLAAKSGGPIDKLLDATIRNDGLAAKSGGPIDKLLDATIRNNNSGLINKLLTANSDVMTELNSVSKNQLNVLISIRDGINMLVSKSGGTGSTELQFTNNPLTQEFYT
jgi:hypothetical protein